MGLLLTITTLMTTKVSAAQTVADRDRYPPQHVIDLAKLRRYRLNRIRAELAQRDYAAGLFFDPINIRYATDSSNMQVWVAHNPVRYVFIATSGPVVLFDFHNCEHLSAGLGTVDEVRLARAIYFFSAGSRMAETADRFAVEIDDLLRQHGGGNRRLAVDCLHFLGIDALRKQDIVVTEGSEVAEQARKIKSAEEIACMRLAIDVCQAGMQRMHDQLEPGMTEIALWSYLHQENIARGSEWIETRLLASGERTNPWFHEASHRAIQAGELVSYDTDLIGPFGYCADISRSLVCGHGKPSSEQCQLYQLAYQQIETNIDLLQPGMSFKEFCQRSFTLPTGYQNNRYSVVAHGVGLCDEYPAIPYPQDYASTGYDGIIEPGMTFCIESYIGHEKGSEGVKLEEQVLVTEIGVERLSDFAFQRDWLS